MNKILKHKNKLFWLAISSAVFVSNLSAGAQWNPSDLSSSQLPNASIHDILYNILLWLLAIFGVIGVIGFVIAGIIYLTAAGDDSRIEKAKKAMEYSIIGIIVGLAGLVIIFAADYALNGQFF